MTKAVDGKTWRLNLWGDGTRRTLPAAATTPITGISWNFATVDERAPGSDNWPACWSDDGHQYSFWGDGGGFGGTNNDGRVSFGVARIEGDFDDYVGVNRYGDTTPGQTWTAEFESEITGKSHGAPISIGGVIYCWVTPTSGTSGYASMTLHKSTNKCQSFTTPGVQFTDATHDIGFGGFINHGQDEEHSDGFVYTLAIEIKSTASLSGTHDHIHLLRVPVADIENQSAYEWFTGTAESPSWGAMGSRQPIYTATDEVGSFPQMTFVPGLNRYVMTVPLGSASSDLRVLEAEKPWGAWTQVGSDFTNWGVTEEVSGGQLFQWNLMPKWFRNGGLDFTMTFTGLAAGGDDAWHSIDGSFSID